MLRGLEGWHFIVLALVFIVLFGAKKLPDSARSLAKSLKIFKSELKNNDKKEE
jgi:sec-independent protein translocase protein TatA